MKTKLKTNKGITLIALVITIIVLLILAGVTIAMLTGENGILGQANQAKTQTEVAEAKERAQTDIIAWQAEQLKDGKDATLSDSIIQGILTGKDYVKEVKATSFISSKGDYEISYKDLYGISEGTTGNVVDGVTVPEGFYYLEGTKNTGIVISDVENDTGNIGNQFVFVPVDNPNEMYGTLADGKKAGKLYNFTLSGYTANNWEETNGVMSIISSTSYREPDILTAYDNNTSYNNGLFTKNSLQQEFDNMIASVIKNKGFYIARYEMSLDASKKAQSKKGKTSSDASQADTSMWYGLYSKAKIYTNGSTKSSMIWGCQYDAMMKWMQKNGIDVTSATPIAGAQKNTSRTTGSIETDKLNNIYDLLGNSYEWTLEAYSTSNRSGRRWLLQQQ